MSGLAPPPGDEPDGFSARNSAIAQDEAARIRFFEHQGNTSLSSHAPTGNVAGPGLSAEEGPGGEYQRANDAQLAAGLSQQMQRSNPAAGAPWQEHRFVAGSSSALETCEETSFDTTRTCAVVKRP
jgi:hypothetical protein